MLTVLCYNTLYHIARHICKPVTAAEMLKCELLVLNTHKVQNGGVKIVYMHRVLNNVVTKFIRFSVNAGLYAAACHPDGEAPGVMVAAIIIFS